MLLDVLIIIFLISAVYRGREIGFIRQLLSTLGFFGGLFFGAWLQPRLLEFAHTGLDRSVLGITVSLSCAVAGMILGEYLGVHIKKRVILQPVNSVDVVLGSFLNVMATLLAVWLLTALAVGIPVQGVQKQIQESRLIQGVNKLLPPAPSIISRLGKLIDPNGFPQVFIGNEPAPIGNINLPGLGDLAAAVQADQPSVVKLEGLGCGGIVDGSGFIVSQNLVATNAHVVAGISRPYVQDSTGTHAAKTVWFDPNLDFAILRVNNLTGGSLNLASTAAIPGQAAAVLGYPGGGPFSANPAAVIDTIRATGRNIYGEGLTVRQVYELKASVVPGNSGGPVVAKDGSVIGVVFAESTTYSEVGYALTSPKLISAVNQASSRQQTVSTGQCAAD
jgi:S1-C subfamily serine protease